MRYFLILIVLLLTGVWAYTSWYWYTCNIKGFCDGRVITKDIQIQEAKAKLIPEREVSQEERRVDSQEETVIVSSDIGAGVQASLLEQELVENDSQGEGLNQQNQELETVATLCDEPIIGPIEFGKNNDIGQVKRLEKYLITERGENLTIDGTYDQADFEAVKRFQLEFKEDILDPWGLTAPTGFVFRTTVQKINETACN